MGQFEQEPIESLAWLAYMAEQLGWHELDSRIENDLDSLQERRDETERRWSEGKEGSQSGDQKAA